MWVYAQATGASGTEADAGLSRLTLASILKDATLGSLIAKIVKVDATWS